uniref:PB1 domain-containing protein n=1 Tax=Hemiselmis andersenii TaxID=464988 RepID=A0A6U4MHZ3_HEMAN|mmetsp:Transcript_2994/g.6834  ORF Transcript_2994/g.6834 Transcript_2994/m.6834 type:complete len:126 (+) Transcript_2994:361-738(+)
MIDQLLSSLTCCSDRPGANKGGQGPATLLITCFNEADKEITDLRIPANTSWSEMQDMITGALGEKAIFVYDDGSGDDFPVRDEKEFLGFLGMVRSNKNVHGEYDIMLLGEGEWERYDKEQKAMRR